MMAKTSLPPGFRFHPTDVELIWYYLRRKIMGKPFRFTAIAEVELYNFAPWDLREKSQLHSKDLEWYFFCRRVTKYSNGPRAKRTTGIGYWKATGKDKTVIHNSCTIGMRKTLVFHLGKPQNGSRTDWVMYEYRLENKEFVAAGFLQDAYVLCKIFQKNGPGPRIGEQFGTPFNEEDYEDDDITAEISLLLPPQPSRNQATTSFHVAQQPLPSTAVEIPCNPEPLDTDGIFVEELEWLLGSPLTENANAEMRDSIVGKNAYELPSVDQEEIFSACEDLRYQAVMSGSFSDSEHPLLENNVDDLLPEFDVDQLLNEFLFNGGSDLSESMMPNNPPTSMYNNQRNVPDAISYFGNDDISVVHDPLHAGADLNREENPPSAQIECAGGFMHHPDVPDSEFDPDGFNYSFQ